MKIQTLFGALCCATFIVTAATYFPGSPALDKETPASVAADSSSSQYGQTFQGWPWEKEEPTSLAAVGWEGCKWCEKFKDETLPVLVEEGYDVRYVDIGDWDGPEVTGGPTLFFFADKNDIVNVHKGFLTADQVKEILQKPDEGE